jgi:protocatechuate 4,5-dioxygenase alpha chain
VFLRGRAINAFCASLDNAAARAQFRANEQAYCLRYGLSKRERQAVLRRDYVSLVELGAHVSCLDKLAAVSGVKTVEAIKQQAGLSLDALIGQALLAGLGLPSVPASMPAALGHRNGPMDSAGH